MRIDVHAHFLSKEYLDLLDRLGGIEPGTEAGQPVANSDADLEARLAVMERAGVGLQILSVSGQMPYFAQADHAVSAARYANDMYAQLVRAHGGKLAGFACLPLPHIDAALAELTRALDELGMVGVTVATSVLGRNLGDRHFDPLYAELDRRSAVMFIHPAGLACGSAPIRAAGMLWPLGGTAEDTLCAVHLLTAGFTVRFPNVKVILPHLGGTLPLLMNRLDRPLRSSLPDNVPLVTAARKFWYDTVNGYPPALRCACEAYGVDRILFGSDYPFFREAAYQWCADYILEAGLTEAQTQAIFSGNAQSLFAPLHVP